MALIAGVVVAIELDRNGVAGFPEDGIVLLWIITSSLGLAAHAWRRRPGALPFITLFWVTVGLLATQAQILRLPVVMVGEGTDLRITGQIEQLDGRHDSRLRLWGFGLMGWVISQTMPIRRCSLTSLGVLSGCPLPLKTTLCRLAMPLRFLRAYIRLHHVCLPDCQITDCARVPEALLPVAMSIP